ncbi:hypothetical protein [Anaerocolumna jejuensis]|uniref:hypothetical protein n=1 Tax=Anaerocolumna jejuensis TaxID=259063 RepID=UPI003F7BF012
MDKFVFNSVKELVTSIIAARGSEIFEDYKSRNEGQKILLQCFKDFVDSTEYRVEFGQKGCEIDEKAIANISSDKISPVLQPEELLSSMEKVFDKCITADEEAAAKRIKIYICNSYHSMAKRKLVELYHIMDSVQEVKAEVLENRSLIENLGNEIIEEIKNIESCKKSIFNDEWIKNKLDENIEILGERFSKDFDIQREEENILDYISGKCLSDVILELFDKAKSIIKYNVPESNINKVESEFNSFIKVLHENYYENIKEVTISFNDFLEKIRCLCYKTNDEKRTAFLQSLNKMPFDELRMNTLSDAELILKEIANRLFIMYSPIILVEGKAGSGKSHFLAHCASEYFNDGGYSILLLGNTFRENTLLKQQIKISLDIPDLYSFDEFLDYLNEAGREKKRRTIFFFDAINEGSNAWNDEIMGFIDSIRKHDWLGLILSIRTNSNENPSARLRDKEWLNLIELKGFHNFYEVSRKFFDYYKIPYSALNQYSNEFNNPLFLKIYSMSYKEQIESEKNGIKAILDNYFVYINRTISEKLGLNAKGRYVNKVISLCVDIILDKSELEYENIAASLCGSGIKNGEEILEELINKGVFNYYTHKGNDSTYLEFEYELFYRYLLAERIVEDINVGRFSGEKELLDFFSDKNKYYQWVRNFDILEMLSVIIPDMDCPYEDGGFEMFNWYKTEPFFDDWMFYSSLVWRNGKKIKPVSYSYLINDVFIRYEPHVMDGFLDVVMKVCITEDHCFNINFLEQELGRFDGVSFHRHWCSYVSKELYENKDFVNILYLAEHQTGLLNKNQKYLLGKTLGWCLISLDVQVRRGCTIALGKIFEEDIQGIFHLIQFFEGFSVIKTGIISEKLWLVFRNLIFSRSDEEGLQQSCTLILQAYENSFPFYPKYFLINEYIKSILEFSVIKGILVQSRYDDFMKNKFKFVKDFYSGDISIEDLLKSSSSELDDDMYAYIEANEEEGDLEEYYKCQNNIVNNLKALYTDVKEEYENMQFITEEYIDIIPDLHKEQFCKKVIKTIFNLGYSYVRLGFHDFWRKDSDYLRYMANNYEKVAFNIVFQEYINSIGSITPDYGKEVTGFRGVWQLLYIEDYDISDNPNLDFEGDRRVTFNREELIQQLKAGEDIYIGDYTNDIYAYLITDMEFDCNNVSIKRDYCVEGFFFHEIFLSYGFFDYFTVRNNSEKVYQMVYSYSWDNDPYCELKILNPKIYQELNLKISKDKTEYTSNGVTVVKNCMKEGRDVLKFNSAYLKNYIMDNRYKIIWVSNKNGVIEKVLEWDGMDFYVC